MTFTDTHTHIYVSEFDADRTEVVRRARAAGATRLLLPNIDEASIAPMLRLCQAYAGFCFPMMGLHPTELPPNPYPLLDKMEAMLAVPDNPYVAVGEVGIDLYWDASRRDLQIEVFRHQAMWAVRYGLPLMIHCRAAHRELVETLCPLASELSGVFHCFGGTADEARELLTIFPHFAFGIGGVLTFKKSKLPAALHAAVPIDRIVLETDAPYLAPAPHRGSRNEPAYIPLVVNKLSEIYALSPEEIAWQTEATAARIFPKAFVGE